jgi:hypothetical protein
MKNIVPALVTFAAALIMPPLVARGESSSVANVKTEALSDRVNAFVRGQYPHGSPYDKARGLGAEAVKDLERVLADRSMKKCWANAVSAVAYIDSPASFEVLRSFLWNTFTGEVDDTTFIALAGVPCVLGTISNRTGQDIVQFLEKGTNPSTWESLPWTARGLPAQSLAFHFSLLSINGLACSSSLRASEALRRLQIRPFFREQQRQVDEALRINEIVRARGIEHYLSTWHDRLDRRTK